MQGQKNLRALTMMALLAAVLAVLGMFKLPGLVPGTEFQLSAPFAVALAACLGFKRYFMIGILASLLNFALGAHTLLNVVVALVFRVVAGGLIELVGTGGVMICLAGPLGTAAARVVMAAIVGVAPWVLIGAAAPGMLMTAVTALVFYPVLRKALALLYGEDTLLPAWQYRLGKAGRKNAAV